MKIVFLTGSHPRHKFIARAIASTGWLTTVVSEIREAHVPEPPEGLDEKTASLFRHHFDRREQAEHAFFGAGEWPDTAVKSIDISDLNGPVVHSILKKEQPDLLLSYGCHKLSDETLALAKGERWNIHGGLSPRYRGAITHFWPSYMLEPQMTGMTIHDLTNQLDAGDVVHQCAADLVRGDGLHELACRAVQKVGEELPAVIQKLASGQTIEKKAHKTSGKIWPSSDWRPEHLHLIYETYQDRIVDKYLDGVFTHRAPNLHRQID